MLGSEATEINLRSRIIGDMPVAQVNIVLMVLVHVPHSTISVSFLQADNIIKVTGGF